MTGACPACQQDISFDTAVPSPAEVGGQPLTTHLDCPHCRAPLIHADGALVVDNLRLQGEDEG